VRPGAVAFALAKCTVQPIDRDERQTVHADLIGHLVHRKPRRQQLAALGRIDAVEAGMRRGWRGNAHMHLARAGLADHLDDLPAGGAADDRIVNQDHPLGLQHRAIGGVLQLHAEMADVVGRLDERTADIVVADDTELEWDAAFGGVAHRCRHSGVRHRYHHVGRHSRLARQFGTDLLARVVDRRALHDRIRPGEVDVFEYAEPLARTAERFDAVHALVVDHDQLARLDVAHKVGADDVERAGLACQYPAAGALVADAAQDQWTHTERIAHAHQRLGRKRHQRIGAYHLLQRVDQPIDHGGVEADRDQVDEHL
jgi:hypothetical protein